MATLALAAAGAAVGSTLLPAGVTVLGATLSGATIGAQIGALAGSFVDQTLFAPTGQTRAVEGPRLSSLHVLASTEGAPVPRLYGRVRVGGQVIWATDFEEEVVTSTTEAGGGGGGKGGGGGGGATIESTEYRYYANLAVAICEGEIGGIGRVWADGAELDLSLYTHRVYAGSETQVPDSLIEAREGAGYAPAYRGLAYIVLKRLPLAAFGNRIPQLSFEVSRPVDTFNELVRGIVMIPGCGEFVYADEPVARVAGGGFSVAENVHTRQGGTDWEVSLDQLETTLPNAQSVSLIVSWFGDDLRAGDCRLRPRVDRADKVTTPLTWSVAGAGRATADVVSMHAGQPAFGGTPSDASVVSAIRSLKERGKSVTLTPFVLMDIPTGNTLQDPYTGAGSQPVYPWRGRITVSPASGQPGSPDKTVAATAQVAAFLGTAAPSDFTVSGGAVAYAGPDEWSYRRFVLHYAALAAAAGGVDAFVIGTELRGLTQVRDGAASYPFVDGLVSLAADCKSLLGPETKITYAADWSEYFGHQPQDGSGDVYFHLDPLWASPGIDAIGIDLYWPLADWRGGRTHLDYIAGARAIHDLAYLRGNVRGGEGFDWYYAGEEQRRLQLRAPISDGAAGKPWVFRYKDLHAWWSNPHFHRPGGVEQATPTAWVPQSKPFWLMEVGCPAVDKGANQPNVFSDPKSSESAVPYFSRGTRDDLIQRRYLEALVTAFDPSSEGYVAGANPVSSVYGGRMLDLDRVYVYAWDARPFPSFPASEEVWGDAANWRLGHWLNGRLAGAPLDKLVAALMSDFGFHEFDAGALTGTVPGYVVERIMSARDALQPLELAYFFDSLESNGRIRFRHRGAEPVVARLVEADLVEERPGAALLALTRAQETELPATAKVTYVSGAQDYRSAVAEARRLTVSSARVAQAELPIVLDGFQAESTAEAFLFEAWASRERARLSLPPSLIAVEPGDVIEIVAGGDGRLFRVVEVGERGVREIEARSIDPDVYGLGRSPERRAVGGESAYVGQPLAVFLDLPLLRGDEPPEAGYVAATQTPWPGGVAFYRAPEEAGFLLKAIAPAPAVIGTTLDALPAGPEWRIDHASRVRVAIESGELASVTRLQLLAGQNVAALETGDGVWEVFQFESAALVAPRTYELSGLLRGQSGSEAAMRPLLPAGARFVLLNGALARISQTIDEVGLPFHWRVGPTSRAIGDASYVADVHTFRGVGAKPLSPVHIRGTRGAGGDLGLSWLRRTRTGGDTWETADVPLGESTERYEIDVLDGAAVKRTIAAASSSTVYTAAEQIVDFGAPQPAVTVRIHQISTLAGRGSGRLAVV